MCVLAFINCTFYLTCDSDDVSIFDKSAWLFPIRKYEPPSSSLVCSSLHEKYLQDQQHTIQIRAYEDQDMKATAEYRKYQHTVP